MASVLNIFFTSTYFFYYYFKWEITIALRELKTNTMKTKSSIPLLERESGKKKLQITTNFFFKGRVVNAASVNNVSVSREFLLFVFLLFGKAGRIEILKLIAEGV